MNAGGAAKRVGLLGWPLRHSLSPRIHEYWMRENSMEEGRYELLPVPPKGLSGCSSAPLISVI